MKPKITSNQEAAMSLIMDLSTRQACLEDDCGITDAGYSRPLSCTTTPRFEDGVFQPTCGALIDIVVSPKQRFPCKFSMVVTTTSDDMFLINAYSRGSRDNFPSIALVKDTTTGRWRFEDKNYQAIELALCNPHD